MVNVLYDMIQGIILFIPAFISNPGAVITGGKGKMDFGRNFFDGRRIFGDGKTISGFFWWIIYWHYIWGDHICDCLENFSTQCKLWNEYL